MFERLRTSFIVPKLIFYTTIALGAVTISLAYAYLTVDTNLILEESARIQDQLTYKVITNSGN